MKLLRTGSLFAGKEEPYCLFNIVARLRAAGPRNRSYLSNWL